MIKLLFLIVLLFSSFANADWYYHIYKVQCSTEALEIVDYSAYNEEGLRRIEEKRTIYAGDLAVWGLNEYDLKEIVENKPYVEMCSTDFGNYKVIIEVGGGTPEWGRWTVENRDNGKVLFKNNMTGIVNKKRVLLFSAQNPNGELPNQALHRRTMLRGQQN